MLTFTALCHRGSEHPCGVAVNVYVRQPVFGIVGKSHSECARGLFIGYGYAVCALCVCPILPESRMTLSVSETQDSGIEIYILSGRSLHGVKVFGDNFQHVTQKTCL